MVLLGATAYAQSPTAVIYQPEVGTKSVLTIKIAAKFDVQGQTINFETEQTNEETVTDVAEDGRVTVESVTTESSTSINGQSQDEEPDGSTSEYVYAANGALVKASPADDDEVAPRIEQAMRVVLPTGPVAAGATYQHNFPGGGNLVKATFNGKIEAFEEKNGIPCVKITHSYKEDGTDEEMSVESTSWVEVADGSVVAQEFKLEGLPVPIPGRPVFSGSMNRESKTVESAMDETGTDEPPADEENEIAAAVEGYERMEGQLTLYRKQEDREDSVLMEVPKELLGEWMMLQATASTGNSLQVVNGMPLMDILFQFQEVQPGRLTMVVPNYFWRADEDLPIATTLGRSFSRSFLRTFDIEAENDESVLIDVTDFFTSDIISLNQIMMGGGGGLFGGMGGGVTYTPDRDNTFVADVKNFPENVVVRSVYSFEGSGVRGGIEEGTYGPLGVAADSRSVVIDVVYNVYALPTNNGFVPRLYDERVGYFTTGYEDFSDSLNLDRRVRYILRWDVRKANPSQRVSDPVEPIVFYLDKGIPEEWREAVKEGILAWNDAFLQAGIRNAIEVRQMSGDDDFDHADMRYNVIRWVASPGDAYAVAQFRFNPLTGQVLNSSITVDLNYISYEAMTVEQLIKLYERDHAGHTFCQIGEFGRMDRAMAEALIRTMETDDEMRQRYLHQAIRHTVAHEFGHILGLRHNFVASTQLTFAQMADPTLVNRHGTSSSVMDYVPFNPHALRNEEVDFFGGPGDYDRWAIAYGYSDVPGDEPTDAHRLLQGLLNMAGQPGLSYRTDQHADGFDPYVARFDLSREPLDYYTHLMNEVEKAMASLVANGVEPGESYYEMTKAFQALFSEYAGAAIRTTNTVAGIRVQQAIRGTSIDRPSQIPVGEETQRRALAMLNQYVFGEKAFNFPKEIYRFLGEDPRDDYGIAGTGALADMNAGALYTRIASLVLSNVLGPETLNRLSGIEFEAPAGSNPLTVHELMTSVSDQVWSEYRANRAVTALRRDLQRAHLNRLIELGIRDGVGPTDSKIVALAELKRIKGWLEGGANQGDAYTRLHTADMLMRVTRALQAAEVIGMGGGGGSADLLQMLLGGRETTGTRP